MRGLSCTIQWVGLLVLESQGEKRSTDKIKPILNSYLIWALFAQVSVIFLILHGEVKSDCFIIGCVPESTFNDL